MRRLIGLLRTAPVTKIDDAFEVWDKETNRQLFERAARAIEAQIDMLDKARETLEILLDKVPDQHVASQTKQIIDEIKKLEKEPRSE